MGTEGEGRFLEEGAESWEGKGEEGCLHLPYSSFLQQTLSNHLITANYVKHLMNAYCITGLVPSISRAACHLTREATAISYPHSTDEETEAKRKEVTGLRSHR